MLLLGSRSITVEGVTVFPDHADPDQFWYLPGPVALRRRDDGRAAFTFIKYKPAAVGGGAKGGGFLTFEVDLALSRAHERRILSKLRSISRRPRLTPAPFDEGSVQVIALDLQGSGGTASTAAAGSFRAVEKILGAAVPSLAGDNNAAFSLTLSQEVRIILEKAFEQGTEPVGVIYDLKYTGMRPALHVEIEADLERVYNQFSASLEAQVYFVRAGIDAAFEKLVQDGAIKIKVIDFVGAADQKEKEQWALDFFKDNLLTKWFEPTLTPGQVAGGTPQAEGLDAVLRRGNELRPPLPSAPPRPAPTVPASTPAPSTPRSPTEGTGQGESDAGGHNVPVPAAAGAGMSPTAGTGFPVESETAPAATRPAKTETARANLPAGLADRVPAGGAAGSSSAAGSGGAGSSAVISFKLRFVHQEERKHVKFVYDRSEATQRTYAPQGFFGLLVADLDRDRHFVEVDLDDPFFREFAVSVEAPFDFNRIGLTSAHVSIDYGDPAAPATLKHGDFVLGGEEQEPQRFQVFMNERLDTSYRYGVQFHFDPQSSWQARQFSYEAPPQLTEDRSLLINPHERLGFLEVRIEPTRVDWEVVDSIDVHLDHGDGDAALSTILTFVKDGPAQTWQVRTDSRSNRDYRYRLVHRLKDGTTRQQGPFTSRASLLPIDDPFPDALALEFVPLLDPATTRLAFLDLEYADNANGYRRTERLELKPTALDPVSYALAVMDPALKTFRYRVTLVGTDNSMRRGPFIETKDTLIAVSEAALSI